MARAMWPSRAVARLRSCNRLAPKRVHHASLNTTKRKASSKAASTTADNEDFYRFTRGRFVQNEAQEMASRYVRFEMGELARVAAHAVGSISCVMSEKFVDGMHNKARLLTMNDGKKVVVKIPNPNAGEAHFTTASEVATMEMIRTVCKIFVPKLYAWCSNALETSVGAEYIIMEKALGVPLKSVWQKLGLADRFALTKNICRFQAAWTSATYEGYGSIYYASDLKGLDGLSLGSPTGDGKYVLGPTTGRDWNDDGRQHVAFDRGPWGTLESYLKATGRREMTCVDKLARLPPSQVTLCGPGTYQSTRGKKLQALECYMQLYRHLIPSDSTISKPSAWHPDLHIENIFVDPAQPTEVTCIIDWQSTEVAPLFSQARQPYFLDHEGSQVTGLDRPHLPSNFAELSPEQQKTANRLLLDQSLCIAYNRWKQSQAPDIWKRFEYQETPAFELLQPAASLLVDGQAIYTARIIEHLEADHSFLHGSGLSLPEHVIAEAKLDAEGALRGMEAMSMIRDTIGSLFPERGCVRPEQYDEAKDALRQYEEQIICMFASTQAERAAWAESWPFDD